MSCDEMSDDDNCLVVTEDIRIPRYEFTFTFVRSSGPGGQNVNKVNTKARLRWPVVTSRSLIDDVKQRFLIKHRRRINVHGELVISSQRFRDQNRNISDCLEKLRAMLLDVAVAPIRRKKTKPSRAAIERRLQSKRERSRRKQLRDRSKVDDES